MDDIYFVSLAEPVAHEHYTESTQNPNEPNLLLPAQAINYPEGLRCLHCYQQSAFPGFFC